MDKELTSKELEEQANALLAGADFEEIKLPKKAKKAAAEKKRRRRLWRKILPRSIPRWRKSWSPRCPQLLCCKATKS